ncbi:desmocollin 2 like [Brienomyrus brachyistius]|uniref:desmocollin 2 like n=1 Tax=Brienomyrus brachyistius TaxID=42636 RepID=UPI0020B37305|nr:desmocollin 2 like [Brienomyrus brachyistius]XP_048832747.1 desmocollin 2 like [Brienomyrus brachyistius]
MVQASFFCSFIVLCGYAESCIPHPITVDVPEEIPPGYVVCKVNLEQCGTENLLVGTSDPAFEVQVDGTVTASRFTGVPRRGRTFSILVVDGSGLKREVQVILMHRAKKVSNNGVLRRSKRRWSPLPFQITENDKPPFPKDVEIVGSDSSVNHTVYYVISGPGVTEDPVDLFSINPKTGMVRVNRPVDREQYPQIVFQVRAYNEQNRVETDRPLYITVNVQDENDNAPQFTGPMDFSVLEQSNAGTLVGVINATDRDDPATIHTKIRYKILNQMNPMFSIDPRSGVLTTATATLDREAQAVHLVPLEIRDMDGDPRGLFSTATATVTLQDINDNPPIFRSTSYKASIAENAADVLLLRLPVDDKDLVNTPNWRAQYFITKGNETGNFRIDTDPRTNEGLLTVVKPFDYEKTRNAKLEVTAQNEAKLEGTNAKWATVPVDVTVTDVDEGPEFRPQNLVIPVKEDVPKGTSIGTYTAIDPDTDTSKGIKYYKQSDPALWTEVVEATGEIRTTGTLDREAPFVKNGTYNVTVKAIDETKKSSTGTITLRIEDVNDNVPEVIKKDLTLCEANEKLGTVVVEAEDKDGPPFSAPFTFQLGNTDGKWQLTDIKNTSAVLVPAQDLPKGQYDVPLTIKDLQGQGKEQTVNVKICHCVKGACSSQDSSKVLGNLGFLALLLPLLLLALLALLLMFTCTTKKEKILMDDASGGMLLKSNTEGPGDEVSAGIVPSTAVDGSLKGSHVGKTNGTIQQTWNQGLATGTGIYSNSGVLKEEMDQLDYAGQFNLHTWKTNGRFLDQKMTYFLTEDEDRYANDLLRTYGYEGQGSLAGSVGCCSEMGDDQGLGFLDSLGPKFKMLADVCTKK